MFVYLILFRLGKQNDQDLDCNLAKNIKISRKVKNFVKVHISLHFDEFSQQKIQNSNYLGAIFEIFAKTFNLKLVGTSP